MTINDECVQTTYANKGSQQILQCFPWEIEPGMRRKLWLSCMNLEQLQSRKRHDFGLQKVRRYAKIVKTGGPPFPFSKEWNRMKRPWLWFSPQTNDFAQAHRYLWWRPDLAHKQSRFPWCGRSDRYGTNQSVYATWHQAVSPGTKVQSPICSFGLTEVLESIWIY